MVDFPKHVAFRDIPVTTVDVSSKASVVTRDIPVAHDDKDGFSADDNHPSTFKEFLEGTERDLRRSRRNANRRVSRAKLRGVAGSANTKRKRESWGFRILSIYEF